jgi:hypothetical protein
LKELEERLSRVADGKLDWNTNAAEELLPPRTVGLGVAQEHRHCRKVSLI